MDYYDVLVMLLDMIQIQFHYHIRDDILERAMVMIRSCLSCLLFMFFSILL